VTPAEQQALTILAKDLETDEGRVPYAYLDSLGFWTIGVGFLIDKRKGGKLYPEEIDFILANRIKRILPDAQVEAWYPAVANDPVRLAAVLNMHFQMGSGVDETFVNSFKAIGAKDWPKAAANLRQSLWAKQTPARAARVIKMIETGQHA
jgi:lysozyme